MNNTNARTDNFCPADGLQDSSMMGHEQRFAPPGRRRRPATRLAVLVSVVTLVGACGGGSASTTSGGAPEEFGLSLTDLTARITNTERSIAACMTQAGFTYTALDFNTIKKAMDKSASAPGLSDESYIKQFGLGITTQPDNPIVQFGAGPSNEQQVSGLAPSDQVAYRRALWGEATTWNHARAVEEEDFSQTGGCTRRAAEQIYAPGEMAASYVNPADTRVEQDPRMIAALKKWSDCMRAKGHQFDHPDQIDRELRERLAALTQGRDPRTLTGTARDAWRELQGEELAIASVHKTCEDTFIVDVQAKVEAELFGGSPT
jgi:hypothetical protein